MLINDVETIGFSIHMPAAIAEELERAQQTTTSTGTFYVSVSYGAGIGAAQNIVIIPGITTVEDVILSATVQGMTGKSVADLRRCKVTVNGADATLPTTLAGGESIRVLERVAGDKGSGDTTAITVKDADGNVIGVYNAESTVETLEDMLDECIEGPAFVAWLNRHGMDIEADGLWVDEIKSICGSNVAIERLYTSMRLFDGMELQLDIKAPEETATTVTTSMTQFTCTVSQGAGINPITVPFTAGATVRDVIFDPTVLLRLHQSASDVERCHVSVNGCRCSTTCELNDRDNVRIEPPVAGDKGVC